MWTVSEILIESLESDDGDDNVDDDGSLPLANCRMPPVNPVDSVIDMLQ